MGRTLGQNQFEYNSLLKNFKQIKSDKILKANSASSGDKNTVMSRLMNLTLEESGISADLISMEEIKTSHLINKVLDQLCHKYKISRSSFHLFDIPNIKGDQKQVEHLFKQVIKNAILYRSSQALEIIISSEYINDQLVFSIQDNGIGIEKDQLKDIFKPFNRGVIKNECSGVGLGLSISRQIVNFHHGEIWAQSLGRSYGSTFYISLPIEAKQVLSVKHAFAGQMRGG